MSVYARLEALRTLLKRPAVHSVIVGIMEDAKSDGVAEYAQALRADLVAADGSDASRALTAATHLFDTLNLAVDLQHEIYELRTTGQEKAAQELEAACEQAQIVLEPPRASTSLRASATASS